VGQVHAEPLWTAQQGIEESFQYLNHHRDLGIHYYRTPTFEPVCYVDADFARDVDEYKSTTGYLFLLAGSVITGL
jgi:hypothetical protein